MSSWFNLVLDTTPPILNIISPQYTSPDILTTIIIESDKPLMKFQDIYFVDYNEVKHDLIFNYDINCYVGKIQFTNMCNGIGTICCCLKDEVGNKSDLISKAINITNGETLKLNVKDFDMTVNGTLNVCELSCSQKIRKLDVKINEKKLYISDKKHRSIISSGVK